MWGETGSRPDTGRRSYESAPAGWQDWAGGRGEAHAFLSQTLGLASCCVSRSSRPTRRTIVILAGPSVLGFILRVEWTQRHWAIVPVSHIGNIWRASSRTGRSRWLGAGLRVLSEGQRTTSVLGCRCVPQDQSVSVRPASVFRGVDPLPHQHEDAEGEGSNGTEVQIMFPSYLYVAFSPMLRLEGTQGIFK